jgi:hypothetical protein
MPKVQAIKVANGNPDRVPFLAGPTFKKYCQNVLSCAFKKITLPGYAPREGYFMVLCSMSY